MMQLRIQGETRRLAEDQDEYFALSIRDDIVEDPTGQHEPLRSMTSAWEPDPNEIKTLHAGGAIVCNWAGQDGDMTACVFRPNFSDLVRIGQGKPVLLSILGIVHPPVQMFVADRATVDAANHERDLCVIAVQK